MLLRKFIGDIIVPMLRGKFFALELKVNAVLRGIFLPGASISARYFGMDDETERISWVREVHLFLTDLVLFSLKPRLGWKGNDSLHWNLAKGGRVVSVCVELTCSDILMLVTY